MLARAIWSRIGRCALLSVAAFALTLTGGCSSGSRFDWPAFNLASSKPEPLPPADPSTTAALPGPHDAYTSGSSVAYRNGGSSLPPPGAQAYPSGATPAVYSPPPRPVPESRPTVHRTPSGGTMIKVAHGDNLYGLSRQYGVSVAAIKEANGLEGNRISVGQKLVIPGEGRAAPPRTVVASRQVSNSASDHDVRVVKTTTIAAPSAPATPAAAQAASAPKPVEPATVAASNEITGGGQSAGQSVQVASVERLPQPEQMSGASFRWPVQGRIVSTFGPKPDGGHNDGIDLAVPLGTPVMAAENGVVAYAGDELKGYGNLVLVRHSNNWVSAYANNDEILVKRGDQVRRGQEIAKAGRTGQASQPQLHFELRRGSRPVDPTKYMTSAQANAD